MLGEVLIRKGVPDEVLIGRGCPARHSMGEGLAKEEVWFCSDMVTGQEKELSSLDCFRCIAKTTTLFSTTAV